MLKVEVEKKLLENEAKIEELKKSIIKHFNLIDKEFKELGIAKTKDFIKNFTKIKNSFEDEHHFQIYFNSLKIDIRLIGIYNDNKSIEEKMNALVEVLEECQKCISYRGLIKDLEDSEPVHFSGDVIITDPCYFVKDDDWPEYVYDLDKLNINNYMVRDTIYGDWSCSVFDSDKKTEIGSFCADAGFVAVADYNEIKKYNPEFHENCSYFKNGCATLIKDFDGDIYFKIKEEKFMYKGEEISEYAVMVVGTGKNKITGEPLNFISSQTGI